MNMQINISLDEVSKKTGVSVDKLRRLRKAGKIPAGWQAHPHAPVVYSLQDVEKIQAVL
jgi:ribosomal protein L25 (general stress protein Ctc)